jgi:type I restriction enzyme S subunit
MSVETDTLESMCELIIDCPHSTPEWTDDGFIVTRNQNIKNGVLDLSSPSFTNKEDYLKRIKRATPQTGDIIFTREAPMGEVCLIPEGLQCCLGQRQVLLRPKDSVCGKYLFWALQSPFVQNQISWNEGTGSTVSNVRIPVLKALNIPRILGHEESIAKVLSDVADKIQLNRETNQTLEQMAQAIFKSWFVDFDPTRAKIAAKLNGQDPERAAMAAVSGKSIGELDQLIPDTQQQLRTTAALFPDELVDSELGEIPEGWVVSHIGNEVGVVGGGTPSTKNPEFWEDGHHHWTTPKDMSNLTDNILLDTARKITSSGLAKISSGLLPVNTVLMSSRAPVGYLAIAKVPVAINQGYIAMKCEGVLTPEYVIQWAESVMDEIQQRASGTTFAEISKKNFKMIPVVIPSDGVVKEFSTIVSGLYEKITEALRETKSLTEIRDSLLPKLLSGEIE